jgi:hypothetical protein
MDGMGHAAGVELQGRGDGEDQVGAHAESKNQDEDDGQCRRGDTAWRKFLSD